MQIDQSGIFITLALTFAIPTQALAYDYQLQCYSDGPGDDSVCVTENFSAYTTPNFLGSNFTSPSGFYFERLTTGPQYQVQTLGVNGNWLFVPGEVSVVHFPIPGQIFSFVLTGGGEIEVATYDGSGNLIQTIVTEVSNETKVVRVGPLTDIEYAIISHTNGQCDYDFNEPFITDVKICEY